MAILAEAWALMMFAAGRVMFSRGPSTHTG